MILSLSGIVLDFSLASGALGWASDWSRVDELSRQGYLRRVFHGPASYGDSSFYATPKLVAEAEALAAVPVEMR